MAMMATPVDVKLEPLPPLSSADSERIRLDCDVRYWALRARFLAQKLLSLGRSYEVRYRVPMHVLSSSPLQLPELGFDVLSVSDAHLLQVKAVSTSLFAQQIVNEPPLAGLRVARPDDVRAIQVEDYLVGVDERDLLVAPLGLPHLRKRLQHLQSSSTPPNQQTGDRVLVMRFVRLDRLVQVNQRRTHGHVLATLAHIEDEHAAMARAYAQLLERNRAVVTRELLRDKKLLVYVRIIARDIQAAVDADDTFQFARGFQQWFAALHDAQYGPPDDDAHDGDSDGDGSDDAIEIDDRLDEIEIEISDSVDSDNDEWPRPPRAAAATDVVVDLTAAIGADAPTQRRRLHQTDAPRRSATHPPPAIATRLPPAGSVRPTATAKRTPSPREPRNVDMSWLALFAAADVKWLPNASVVLRSFISRLLEGFEQDARCDTATATRVATAIAEQLVRVYIHKRFTLAVDNAALYKDFARHVRMLSSNVKDAKSAKLRADLLHGAIQPAQLCAMSVDELAPEALRRERARRYEEHAQRNVIRAPTGPTLVKTKHGYKEVNFGACVSDSSALETESGVDSVEADTTAAAAVAPSVDHDMSTASAPFEFDAPTVVAPADARDLPVVTSLAAESNNGGSSSNGAADIAQQFEAAVGIASRPVAAPKKRVSFANDLESSAPPARATTSSRDANDAQTPTADARRQRSRARSVVPSAGRAFLLTLFDPAQDVVESLRMYIETLETAPLATMSREFLLTPDVTLFRDSRANAELVYTARLQLAHLVTESAHRSERRANIDAAYKLIDAVRSFRMHVDDLLTQLRLHFGLSADNCARQVCDRVFSFLVEKSMVKYVMPPVERRPDRPGIESDEVEAQLLVFELSVAQGRNASDPIARGEASQELLAFLIDLLAMRAKSSVAPQLPLPHPHQSQQPYESSYESSYEPSYEPSYKPLHEQRAPMAPPYNDTRASSNGYHSSDWLVRDAKAPPPHSYSDDQNMGANRFADHEPEPTDDVSSNQYRKRHYEPSRETWSDEPLLSRRRTDDPVVAVAGPTVTGTDEKPLQPVSTARAEPDAPMFYADSVGERQPHADRTQRVLTETQRIQSEVGAYQGLVTQLFKNRDGLMTKLRAIDWDTQREVANVDFDDKFTVVRIAKWVAAAQRFECEIQAFGQRLVARGTDKRLDVAGRRAADEFAFSVDSVYAKWKVLVRTYRDRKLQASSTLMAANEARAKNQSFVDMTEKRAGHLYECCIFVNRQMAIRHCCMNQKMAKRSASEEFRDVLDTFLRLEEARQTAGIRAASSSSSSATATSAVTNTTTPTATAVARTNGSNAPTPARAPAPSRRASNLVLCSDDELDDDDDDYASDYSSGSDYGGGAPAAVKSDKPPVATADDAAASSLKARIEREKKAPYDKASEATRTDDARFRAVVRSLFTANDALCAGIDALRGSLKFRGSAENVVVPNVTAAIDMERLREGVYEVHVAVNDVVQFTASKVAKADACSAAIDGALRRLHDVRAVWVQLLNFFHTKELAVSDLMTSFHALRLANITSITSVIEKPALSHSYDHRTRMPLPPSAEGVHCVLRVGSHVAYRVVGDTEDEALQLADCLTAKFIMDLIDDGLHPDPDDVAVDADATNKMHVDGLDDATDGALVATAPSWSCDVRISDFIDSAVFHTFRVDGTWRQARDLPPSTEFPPPHLVATQVEKVEIAKLEAAIRDWHGYVVKFFSIESAHEQWKLVRHVAAYGHKSKQRAFALKLALSPAAPFDMYLIPPGASINSEENLYWPKSVLPRTLPDRKQIYGLLRVRSSYDESAA